MKNELQGRLFVNGLVDIGQETIAKAGCARYVVSHPIGEGCTLTKNHREHKGESYPLKVAG